MEKKKGKEMSKNSLAEDMVLTFSRLPWWVSVLAGIIIYLILDYYGIKPGEKVDTTGVQLGTMGAYTVKQIYKTIAYFAKFLFAFVFGLSAFIALIRSIKEKRAIR